MMRSIANKCLVLATILLVFSTLFQGWALFCVLVIEPMPADVFMEKGWFIPVWCVTIGILPVTAVLCKLLKNRPRWLLLPLFLAAAGTVMALIVTLALRDGLPVWTDYWGEEHGLTTWKLCYRHLSSVIAGLLTALAAVFHMAGCRQERLLREEEAYQPIYHLEGKPVFKDSESGSTLGLDEDDRSRHRLKRSQRRMLEKKQEQREKQAQKKPSQKKQK